MSHLLGFVLGSSCLLYIGSTSGFGPGSNWLLYIGVPLIIGIWAQIRVSSAFGRWSKVRASANITGAECAREVLQAAQIQDVEVVETNDFLGDHYDPTKKQLHLSSNVYNTPSVAALGIAAHECGHAIQHARAYAPLKARMAIVPVTMIASQMLPFIIIGGLFFRITGLITLGIWCYLILLVFQLITLPVEFDASRRAKIILREMGIIQPGEEAAGVNRVLNAAALTGQFALVDVDPRSALINRTTQKWITLSLYLLVALPICYRRVWRRVLSLSVRRWISQEATQTRSW
jgi:uncharacterized protein